MVLAGLFCFFCLFLLKLKKISNSNGAKKFHKINIKDSEVVSEINSSMNCNIDTTPDFVRELKQLAKRYPSMKDDYRNFLDSLRKSVLLKKFLNHLFKFR